MACPHRLPPQGSCKAPRIYDVRPTEFVPRCTYCEDYFWGWTYYLPAFDGAPTTTIINDPQASGHTR